MRASGRPSGWSFVLIYSDEQGAIGFLTRAFGFQERARIDTPDGSRMAWLGLGDGIVMISGAAEGRHRESPRGGAKPTAMLNLHVDEIDAHYQRAVAQGARIVTNIENTAWGYRRYEALDPEGNRWHVMQELTHQTTIGGGENLVANVDHRKAACTT